MLAKSRERARSRVWIKASAFGAGERGFKSHRARQKQSQLLSITRLYLYLDRKTYFNALWYMKLALSNSFCFLTENELNSLLNLSSSIMSANALPSLILICEAPCLVSPLYVLPFPLRAHRSLSRILFLLDIDADR